MKNIDRYVTRKVSSDMNSLFMSNKAICAFASDEIDDFMYEDNKIVITFEEGYVSFCIKFYEHLSARMYVELMKYKHDPHICDNNDNSKLFVVFETKLDSDELIDSTAIGIGDPLEIIMTRTDETVTDDKMIKTLYSYMLNRNIEKIKSLKKEKFNCTITLL
jgi:hypothetical protein